MTACWRDESADGGAEDAAKPIGDDRGGGADGELAKAPAQQGAAGEYAGGRPGGKQRDPNQDRGAIVIAAPPEVTTKGRIGMAAPLAKAAKLDQAAVAADPTTSWSATSASRESSAPSSPSRAAARCSAWSAGRPLARKTSASSPAS